MAAKANLRPEQKAFRPFGAAEKLFYDRADEIILSGPAGTGKSRACLEKLHLCAEKYAGMRALIIRKTRHSCTDSALVTFEDKVLPDGHPALKGANRQQRHAYTYPNRSEIVIGGMDKPTKIMSTEYDMIYVQEAIELLESDIEALTTRLRNGAMPYQQLIGDTNPDRPNHWIKLREKRGTLKLIESRHEDNPVLFDQRSGLMTTVGAKYLERLDSLTGVRYWRLRKGLWVAAEGLVYEGYDPAIHRISRDDRRYIPAGGVPDDWPRYWTIDFGFKNPFVWQEWVEDPDGRLFLFREIYKTKTLVEDHAERIKEVTKNSPRPRSIECDHDAEDRATLEKKLGLKTKPAHKSVSDGIQAVASRLKVQADGKPRLLFMDDALVDTDADLVENKLPTCTVDEIEGYIWDVSSGRKRGEEPVKDNDHGMDTMRYRVAQADLRTMLKAKIAD